MGSYKDAKGASEADVMPNGALKITAKVN